MNLEKPLNILVRRRAAIGDVIMSTGVVRELKKLYGDNANIDVITENIGVYRNNPHVRTVMHTSSVIDPAAYHAVYNLDDSYEYNPAEHFVDNYFYQVFGTTEVNRSTELFPSDEDKAIVEQDIVNEIGDKFIVVHMRNWHWTAKNISMDVWFEVYAKLFESRSDFKVVTVGGPTDFFIEDHPLFVDKRTKYNDQQLKYLCDHAYCFVGIDSGPYWAASASDTHIVALLTHLRPACILPYRNSMNTEFGILGHNCTAIQTLEDCAGCNDIQQRPVRQLVCGKGNTPCSSNFDSDAIAKAILEQLG
jgi:ADP-heptose:LPS heptosyltransferase